MTRAGFILRAAGARPAGMAEELAACARSDIPGQLRASIPSRPKNARAVPRPCRANTECQKYRGALSRKAPQKGSARGKVFEDHKQAVAFHVIGFRAESLAGRVRIAMLDDGAREHVTHSQPAQRARRPRSVSSQYRKKSSSKKPDFFQHLAAIQGGGAAGKQRLLRPGKSAEALPVAALLTASVPAHQHARGIQPVLAEEPNLRGGHPGIGAAIEGADERVEPAGMRHGIIVKGGEIGRGGSLKSLVDGGPVTAVAGIFDYAGAVRYAVAAHQTLAAVIDNDHFEVLPGLPVEGLDTRLKPRIGGQGGNHHRC